MADFAQVKPKHRSSINEILKQAVTDLRADSGSLMIFDTTSENLIIKAAYSADPSRTLSPEILATTKIKLGESIAGYVASTKEPLIINDITALNLKLTGYIKKTDPSKYKTSIVIPILDSNSRTMAVLNINNKTNGEHFSNDDFNFAKLLGEYCGEALILEKKNMELVTLNEIIHEINQTNDLDVIFKMIVEKGKLLVNCKNVSIMMVESPNLVVRQSTDRKLIGEKRQLGVGVSGWVWKTGEPILIKKIEENTDDRRFEILNKPGSFIVAPLNLKYETPFALNVALKSTSTIGVLNFSDKENGISFDEDDLTLILNYANLTAIAIEKVKFYIETKKAYLSTVEALAAAIDAKDRSSYNHLKRVVRYSLVLAEKLNLSAKEKEDLHFAALLHDVGKIGITEVILNKPSRLTNDEYEIMKKHVEEGVKILVNVPFLEDAAIMVKYHHEKFDGSGYPDKLKGQEIPVGARILAITDSYDAMISERVYKKNKTEEEAVAELIRCSGTHFDPVILEIFLDVLKTMKLSELPQ